MHKFYFFMLALIVLLSARDSTAQDSVVVFRSNVDDVLAVPRTESLSDLLNIQVVTASNTAEKIADAPASMLVLTREQLQKRGYTSLIDFMQDLPGVDMSVSHGDTYFKAYFRGYRNTIGDAFLLMIDGIVLNDLYFNQVRSMIALPLSNIEQIEVVYGPASSIYGANASMGVINVITKKGQSNANLNSLSGIVSMTANGYGLADLNYLYRKNKFGVSVTGRYQSGNLNQKVNPEDFYWTQNKWNEDKKLWGDFTNNKNLAGSFSSPEKSKALDFRLFTDKIEMGLQYFEGNTGYGTTYPADRIPSASSWNLPEKSIFARYSTNIGKKIFSKTLIRYRTTAVDNSSTDIEGYNVSNKGTSPVKYGNTDLQAGETMRIMAYSYWHTFNESVSFFQDFDWQPSEKLLIKFGVKYEDKNLQKAYDILTGDLYFPDSLKKASLANPPQATFFDRPENRINWVDKGGYIQTRYNINENYIIHAGMRLDNNSSYGSALTLRAGIIKKMNQATAKLFYGEAFQEPVPRLLYGGWKGSGSDPYLAPERSRTLEANGNYIFGKISQSASLYWVQNYNTIINYSGGAANAGERQVVGLEYELRAFLPWKKTEIWLQYSGILHQEEKKFNSQKEYTGTGIIGDLATHKIFFGFNSELTKKINLNMKGRFIGKRETVSTNPLGEVPAFFVLDANLNYSNFIVKGLGLNLGVTNIFNSVYFHAGLRDAGSGNTGGTWDGRKWVGSSSWYNSYLPQPRRQVVISLVFSL